MARQQWPRRHDVLHTIARTAERQRKDDISRVSEPSVPSGSGAWCVIENNSGWAAGVAGTKVVCADLTPAFQSGGFELVDPQTLTLPDGIYTVEFAFDFHFPFLVPYGEYVGDGWMLWRAGPAAIAGSVRNYTSYNETLGPTPMQVVTFGGGGAELRPRDSGQILVWRGIVQAAGAGNKLTLAVQDIHHLFGNSLAWTDEFTWPAHATDIGTGDYYVSIASI